MASPQLENGYLKIARVLTEKLALLKANGSQFRILWAIIRKTYGWKKKEDNISYGQIAKATGLGRRQAIRECKKLQERRILKMDRRYRINKIGFQKDYDKWILGGLKRHLVANPTPDDQKDTGVVAKQTPEVVSNQTPTIKNKEILTIKKNQKPKKARTPKGDPRVTELQTFYLEALKTKIDNPTFNYPIAGKKFKELLRTQTPEEIKAKIIEWFSKADRFYVCRGYRVEDFASQYNALKLKKEVIPEEVDRQISLATVELARIASKRAIIKWLALIPENYHWRIKNFLEHQYRSEGGKSFYEAQDEYFRNKDGGKNPSDRG